MVTIEEWLQHPLVLLIVGAAFSGWLIPMFSRKWQDRQKEVEIKNDLVTQISNSVASIIIAIQFAIMGASSQSQSDFDKAYKKWEIDNEVISSRLRAHFPDNPDIGNEWDDFSKLVTDFYALIGILDEKRRKEHVLKIQDSFSSEKQKAINSEILSQTTKNMDSNSYLQWRLEWNKLKELVLEKKDVIVQKIIKSRILGYK